MNPSIDFRHAPPAAARLPGSGGFTLVELLIVMTIAAILISIAAASYQASITNYRLSTETNGLVGDLQYARSEAIKQGFTVTICASTDGQSCSGGTSWQLGHVVLTNPTNIAAPTAAAGATLLRAQGAFTGSDTVASGGISAISFNRDGFASLPSGSWNVFGALQQPVVLAVQSTPAVANIGNCVIVSNIGQISVIAAGVTSTTAATTAVTCP